MYANGCAQVKLTLYYLQMAHIVPESKVTYQNGHQANTHLEHIINYLCSKAAFHENYTAELAIHIIHIAGHVFPQDSYQVEHLEGAVLPDLTFHCAV